MTPGLSPQQRLHTLVNEDVKDVMRYLRKDKGAPALVGGCVRDALLGRPVNDVDIATRLHPDMVKKAMAGAFRVVDTGIDHGTVTVVTDSGNYEVTTFRKDVETDGRRAVVAYADTMEEDAMRRDFTINALYYSPMVGVMDPTMQGMDDLDSRTLRFIGDADARCQEDYLRILRLFRFSATLGFDIDPEALAAAERNRAGLSKISGERIFSELKKLLGAPYPLKAVSLMDRTGILPGLNRCLHDLESFAILTAAEHLNGTEPRWQRRWYSLWDEDIPYPHSKADANLLGALHDVGEDRERHAGYTLKDADAAEDTVLSWWARAYNKRVHRVNYEEIRRGVAAVLPITNAEAVDLAGGPGPRVRDVLEHAESIFQTSRFTMEKEDMLERLRVLFR